MKWQCLVIKFQFWETYDQAVPHIELFLGFVVFFAFFFFLCVCVCVVCLFVCFSPDRPSHFLNTERWEKNYIGLAIQRGPFILQWHDLHFGQGPSYDTDPRHLFLITCHVSLLLFRMQGPEWLYILPALQGIMCY